MIRTLSEKAAFDLISESCSLFNGISSFDELRQDGWIVNKFFIRDIPYVWRDNRWISEDRFWRVFMEVFSKVSETSGLILFCDGRSWWKKNRKNREKPGKTGDKQAPKNPCKTAVSCVSAG